MISVKADRLSPGDLPNYTLPDPWPHRVMFVDKTGDKMLELAQGSKRVMIPEFELSSAVVRDSDEALRLVRLKVLQFMADFCVASGLQDGTVLMPVRHEMVLGVRDGCFGCIGFGLMITHPFDAELQHTYSWVPQEIHDIAAFAADVENNLTVMGVMLE